MVTYVQAGGIGQVAQKWDPSKSTTGDKMWYTIVVAFLGDEMRLNCNEEDYNAVSEGDEVKVTGTPYAVDGSLKLRRPSITPLTEGGAGKKSGIFSKAA